MSGADAGPNPRRGPAPPSAAVFPTGEWDAAEEQGPPHLDRLRRHGSRLLPDPHESSATYEADTESIVATLPGGGALEYLTDEGLPAPGATASYKVYVILTTGNERGSDPVTATRTSRRSLPRRTSPRMPGKPMTGAASQPHLFPRSEEPDPEE